MLHIEIDRLGGVNDIYGRGQGDLVLAVIAQRLRACIRGGDLAAINPMAEEPGVVARLGDSAFSILIADLESQERASVVAQPGGGGAAHCGRRTAYDVVGQHRHCDVPRRRQ